MIISDKTVIPVFKNFRPFDFFPASNEADLKIRDWKLAEATRNNSELLNRAAAEANARRFPN